jgi:hypothetical protein
VRAGGVAGHRAQVVEPAPAKERPLLSGGGEGCPAGRAVSESGLYVTYGPAPPYFARPVLTYCLALTHGEAREMLFFKRVLHLFILVV